MPRAASGPETPWYAAPARKAPAFTYYIYWSTTSDYFHLPYQNTRFVTAVCQLQVSFMTNFCGWSFNIVQVLKLDPQKLVMKPTCNRHTAVTKTSILAKNTPKTRQNAGV